ncbi:MAG TPA: hypothetical protein DCE41_10000 [Cytophagales bacterium]|nr:hypothetical protein [Cytophagales bacterium]HAP64772.1 hypothetical protein [Cytophagales bacterium]
MPVYSILSTKKLSALQKERVAKAVTDVHCDNTGAPSFLVTVLFQSGYPLQDKKNIQILGNIRKDGNRTPAMIEQLRQRMVQAVADALGFPLWRVDLDFLGVQSYWVWEIGQVVPPPGQEEGSFRATNTNPSRRVHR